MDFTQLNTMNLLHDYWAGCKSIEMHVFVNSEVYLLYSKENHDVTEEILDKCFVDANKLEV